MTDAGFRGFDVVGLMTTAGAQPNGSQKARYCQDVAAALGANPILEIVVGGVVKYRSIVTGTLTGAAAGITLPTQFVEPATINIADPLTAASAVVVLRNANSAAISISIPVKASVAAGFLVSSKALNGIEAVRTNSLTLVPPVTLDIGSGGDPGGTGGLYSKVTLINDMTLANENGWGLELAPNTQRGSAVYAQITVAIKRSDGDSGYPDAYLSDSSLQTPYDGYRQPLNDSTSVNILGWIVAGRASGATARSSNSRLQIRGYKLLGFRRDGSWTTLATAEEGIFGASWHADFAYPNNETFTDIEQGSTLYQARTEAAGNGGGSSLGSIGYGGWGTHYNSRRQVYINKFSDFALHAYPIGYTNTRKWWVDNIRGFVQVCEARMIVHDATKPDDRANAKIMIWSGADWRAAGTYISDGAGVGRVKLVGNDWGLFSWGSVPTATLNSNPPPGYS